ncbi:hypothetical protein [Sporosarcina highlanderae]|uniref:Lipoprotein n=1 Tax=Sporosarcina highlanderae TaxID=3035916 RepID=A0ABT8JSS9_9BACL|nr:hypothetical protein [Sporosarcina highlanderae]MDN4607199.1 hypothetical protein [Sporosarcina highlanderae]
MKKYIWSVLILSIAVIFAGCTKKEVIRVGTPFNDDGVEGINFHYEITESKSIKALREIVKNADEIDKPKELGKEPEIFFSLDRPKEGISEIRRYVYYQDDGSSILCSEGVSGPDGFLDMYFSLNENQTNELKNVLQ